MSERSTAEEESLESRLEKALEDAWSKVNIALDRTSRSSADVALEIWFAAEALEYSSLLFNLTYGLEDVKPAVKLRKGEAALVLVKDSMELLKQVREGRRWSVPDAYVTLRTAADYLKVAHLDQVKKSTKKRG
ncbi:MAG TPA: hypothetical protein VF906_02425 [Candidatus Bathyarchaeia archaeon]